jgi:hypothetical protein
LGENKNKYMLNSNYNAGFSSFVPQGGTTEDKGDLDEDLKEEIKEELEGLSEPAFSATSDEEDEDEDDEEAEEELTEDEEEVESDDETDNDESPFVPLGVAAADNDDDSENTSPIFSSIAANTLTADDEDEVTEEEPIFTKASSYAEAGEDEETVDDDCVVISKAKIILVNKLLRNIRENTDRLSSLLSGIDSEGGNEDQAGIAEISDGFVGDEEDSDSVIEGVFNGENMIGPDGHEYAVPANYASKSKLVEGDMLKLTITDRGTFRYKQTKPIERKRIIGKLEKDAEGNYLVKADHKKFRVITASITYYKGVPGDKVVILIPVAGDSAWAAVENVIKSK